MTIQPALNSVPHNKPLQAWREEERACVPELLAAPLPATLPGPQQSRTPPAEPALFICASGGTLGWPPWLPSSRKGERQQPEGPVDLRLSAERAGLPSNPPSLPPLQRPPQNSLEALETGCLV